MGTISNPDWLPDDQDPTTTGQNTSTTVIPDTDNSTSGPGTTGSAASVPSTSGLASSSPAQTSAPAAPTQRGSTSGFTNLKQYIQANQGNNLANIVTSGAQSQLNTANQNLQQGEQTFDTGLATQRAKIQAAAGQANDAINYIQTGTNAPTIPDQAPTAVAQPQALRAQMTSDDPTAYAAAQDAYNKQLAAYNDYQTQLANYTTDQNTAAQNNLMNLKTLNYSGPTALNNLDQLNNANQSAQDFATATNSENGRGAILQTLFGKNGQYSSGARNFDNLLLGSNQSNLNQLQGIRTQAANFGQNLNQTQQQATAGVGATQGQLDTTKAQEDLNLKNLRDSLMNDLQNQAATTNATNEAKVASGLTTPELQTALQDIAGYTLTNAPTVGANGLSGNASAGVQLAGAIKSPVGSVVGQPQGTTAPQTNVSFVAGSQPANGGYINLYENNDFAPEDVVDPNATFTRNIGGVGGGIGGGSGQPGGTSSGQPNAQQVYVGINDLKPLFNQTYTDNNWQSINANELNRRNILSNVLGDNSTNGLVTPTALNTIQTNTNSDLLEKLKQTPKMVQDQYNSDIESGTPGTTAQQVLSNLPNSIDPFALMKNLGIAFGDEGGGFLPSGFALDANHIGQPNDQPQNAYYDPKQQMVVIPQQGGGTRSTTTQEFLNNYVLGSKSSVSWNNSQSPAAVANALKEQYILSRLNSLGIANPTIQIGNN